VTTRVEPSRRNLALLLAGLVVVASADATAAPPARATVPTSGSASKAKAERVKRARELFLEAVALSQQERWEEASSKYAASLALKRAPLTLYSLGVTYRESGRRAAAMQAFQAFLAEPTDPEASEYREAAEEALATLAHEVARVVVDVEPRDAIARVRIDGSAACGSSRSSLGAPCVLDPGEHTVDVAASGYLGASRRFRVEAGDSSFVRIDLAPLPKQDSIVGPVLVGVGATSAVAGIVLGVVGLRAIDASADVSAEGIGATVAGGTLLATGIAATAVGALMWVFDGTPSRDDRDRARIGPEGLAIHF
jgi:hypothetical protein